MKRNTCFLAMFLALATSMLAEKRTINQQWSFKLGDVAEASQVKFDDSNWRSLNLPHDWAFENGYSIDGAQKDKGGYACGGIGWYRKTLKLSASDIKSSKIYLDFDAAYMNSKVWINGHYLGHCPYGYVSFAYDVTPYVKEGDNLISVRIDNSKEPSARWYHGCGIYGNVYLRTHGAAYFEPNATFVRTDNEEGNVSIRSLVKRMAKVKGLSLVAEITDESGKLMDHCKANVGNGDNENMDVMMKVGAPRLWSPEHPVLYNLKMKLVDRKNHVIDEQNIRVGFRSLDWTPAEGFFLNGQQYKVRGVCEHLEGGPTGAIYTPQLLRWKLQLIKDMGCNAIRTAHNPQLPYFYDLCDEIGLLVMDEVFDGWKRKADFDYGMQAFEKHWEKDLRSIIRRDRNHPCVFIYSMGNETRGSIGPELVRVCHEEDATRKVTSGTGSPDVMDVRGINGDSEGKSFIENYQPKGQAFIGTENPHTWQVRGFYRSKTWYRDGYNEKKASTMMYIPDLTEKEIFTYDWTSPDKKRNRKQVFNSSYDNATVRVNARRIIEVLRDKPWFSGSFRWTGFDYLGEAGYVHGGWPFRAFQSGALDLAGFPKDLYYLYQSEWTDKDMVHILPHWSHPMMKEGTEIPVWVYTTGDEVELKLNGKSLGRQHKGKTWDKMQCQFLVPWTPGQVEAIAYRNGKEIARTQQITAGAPSKLGIHIENETLKADGENISIITIRQEDVAGTLYPYGENRVHVYVDGPARVLSFENGSPVDVETNFNATSRRCFFGLNRIFLQSAGVKVEDPVSVVLAAISGDKKLKQSDKITINCVEKILRGKKTNRNIKIYYTTDGTQPTTQSQLYQGAFSVVPGTTVRAVVFDGQRQLMQMTESFGPEEGLYWAKNGEDGLELTGDQAEQMELAACKKVTGCASAMGGAYVAPTPGKGQLSWYQENDGGKMNSILSIRYSQQDKSAPSTMGLFNNGKLVTKINFANTGSENNHWKEIRVKVTIFPGANQFSLKSMSKASAPSIDQVNID